MQVEGHHLECPAGPQDLVEAIEAADRLKQQGIETTRENIAKLGELAT